MQIVVEGVALAAFRLASTTFHDELIRVSTPQQKCIGWPEQKYINDAGEQGPELGAFVRHQTWAGLSAGVSGLARRERLLL